MSKLKSELPHPFRNMAYQELKERISSVTDLQDRALFSIVYVCYARIGEIVRGRHFTAPLKMANIEKQQSGDKNYLTFHLTTLKNKTYRQVIFSLDNPKETWLAETITTWLERKAHQEYCFEKPIDGKPLCVRWAEKRFLKWFGTENIHLLRSWRATHAARGDFTISGRPWNLKAVQQSGGWKSIRTLEEIYNVAEVKDYINDIL